MSDEFTALLSPYLDGELPAKECSRLESHLAQCAACRAELEELRETGALLGAVRVAAAPVPALEVGLRNRFRRRAARLLLEAILLVGLVAGAVVVVAQSTALLRPGLPLWFRLCRLAAIVLLAGPAVAWVRTLLGDATSLVEYGWLNGKPGGKQ